MISKKEIAGHAVAGFGQNLFFGLWGPFIMIFYTDIFGLQAAFVGGLMLFARMWDAVNDPLMGLLADKTRTKWGRFRPYLLFTSIPIGVMLILSFSAPNLSITAKMAYAAITYILMGMIYTASDIPYWTLPSAMTMSPQERTTIFSTSRLFATLGSLLVGIIAMPVISKLGGGMVNARGYQSFAIILAVVGSVLFLTGFFTVREHIEPSSKKTEFRKSIKAITSNKPLIILFLTSALNLTSMFLKSSMNTYYAQYLLGDIKLFSLLSLVALPGIVLSALMAPFLVKKFGKKRIIITAYIINAILGFALFFIGYNSLAFVLAVSVLTGLTMGISFVLFSALIADTIEYAELKTGQRNEGLISSAQTFLTKLGLALGGGIAGFLLDWSGYIANATQSSKTVNVIFASVSIIPGIASLIAIVPMLFYTLTEKEHARIVLEIQKRKNKTTEI